MKVRNEINAIWGGGGGGAVWVDFRSINPECKLQQRWSVNDFPTFIVLICKFLFYTTKIELINNLYSGSTTLTFTS